MPPNIRKTMAKITAALLALALALTLANADAQAHFFSSATSASPDALLPISSVQAHFTPDGFYYERVGQYSVEVAVNSSGTFVTVTGQHADLEGLMAELEWLSAVGAISNSCEGSPQVIFVYYGKEYCDITACAGESCRAPQAPTAPLASEIAQKAGLSMATSFGADASAPAGKPPAPPQPNVTPEQLAQLFFIFLAIIVSSYLVLSSRQETVQIGPQEIRLLENETRAGIMHELEAADRIPTDLSSKLGKSKATVVEHLESLVSAGFVEKLATPGRKFVYYRLTRKGKLALLRRAA